MGHYSGIESEYFGSTCQYEYGGCDFFANGSFGVVYTARITERGDFTGEETVAVKVIRVSEQMEPLGGAGIWERLRDRWRKLLLLKHDHVVPYHKVAITRTSAGASVEFVMDYYSDKCLNTLLMKLRTDRQSLDQSEVTCFAMQIADALAYLHQNNIIHGDLKPGNVLVKRVNSKHRRLVVGDLDDFVKMRHTSTSAGDISKYRGTIHFMSPEMLKKYLETSGEAVGRKTDVWSLGCIYVELANAGRMERLLYNRKTREYLQDNFSELRFSEKILQGFVPCTINPIQEFLAMCIENCLRMERANRASARDIQQMLHGVPKVLLQSPQSNDSEKCSCMDPFALSKSLLHSQSFESHSQPTGSRDVILLYHYFKSDGTSPNACVQLFDPASGTLREMPFPESVGQSRNFSWSGILVDNLFVCTTDETLVACDFVKQASRTISFPSSNALHYLENYAMLNKKVFFWKRLDECPLQVMDSSGESVTALPKPTRNITKAAAKLIAHNNKVICCVNSKSCEYDRWVECFDLGDNQWESLPDMPDTRKDYALAAVGGGVYFLGGTDDEGLVRSCLRLDIESGTWKRVADLPCARAHHGALAVGEQIYVFGGSIDNRSLCQTVQMYDSKRDVWSDAVVTNLDHRELDSKTLLATTCVPFKWPITSPFPVSSQQYS